MTSQQLIKKIDTAKVGDIIINNKSGSYYYKPTNEIVSWYKNEYKKATNDISAAIEVLVYVNTNGVEELVCKEMYKKNFVVLKNINMSTYKAFWRNEQIDSIFE